MRDISSSTRLGITGRARGVSFGRVAPAVLVLGLSLSSAAPVAAQAAPPPQPGAAPQLTAPPPAPPGATAPPSAAPPAPPGAAPPGYYPPPGAYPAPPPGYTYPPGYYGYPAPMRAPESVPYDGGPVPAGFHVEERPRRGLLIAGPLVLGIPWVIGLTIASDESFPNSTGWLVVPALGPWITLAARHRSSDCSSSSSTFDNCIDEALDSTTRTFLVLDGLTQTAGAIMLIYGIAAPQRVVTRNFMGSLHVLPAPVGRTGMGGFITGEF